MAIVNLAIKSFRNRKATLLLTIISIALSSALLLAIEKIRTQAKESFTSTISGTDLIVGARSSSVNLLLSSVFQMGNATNGIKYESYEEISAQEGVTWSIPYSLGDSHKGHRVIGTNQAYFQHYKYGNMQPLQLTDGQWFSKNDHVVIGSKVAEKLGYTVNDSIILSHGKGESFQHHDDAPFTIVGILSATATPIDRSLFISLEGIEALHVEQKQREQGIDPLAFLSGTEMHQVEFNNNLEEQGNHQHSEHESHQHAEHEEHQHDENDAHNDSSLKKVAVEHHDHHHEADTITGFYLGLEQRVQALTMMSFINKFEREPIMAIMPGVALLELWSMLSIVEKALMTISILVVVISLFSMLIILLTSINQRRREMAILRAIGAKPSDIFTLIVGEAAIIVTLGLLLGLALLYGLLALAKPLALHYFGIYLSLNAPTSYEWSLLAIIGISGMLISLWPSIRLYRYTLADGMSIKF